MKPFPPLVPAFVQRILALATIAIVTAGVLWVVKPGNPDILPAPATESTISQRDTTISRYIYQLLEAGSNPDTLRYPHVLKDFYRERSWQPIWQTEQGPTALGDSAIAVLSSVYKYGLVPRFYQVPSIKKDIAAVHKMAGEENKSRQIARLDVQLTTELLRLMSHLHHGKTGPVPGQVGQHEAWVSKEGKALLCKAIAGNQFSATIAQCQPQVWVYQTLQQALATFVQTVPLDSVSVSVPDPKIDSVGSYKALQEALVRGSYLSNSDTLPVPKEKLAAALMQFQQANGLEATGKPGPKTRMSLGRSSWDRFLQVAITLERLRQDSITDPAYLLLNIPAFELYICEKNGVLQTHRLVVGQPHTPTHPLSSRISYIVVAPEWNVPHSIATKEMLPRIKANPGYLAENNLMVLNKNGKAADPGAIDWHQLNAGNFPYLIRQQPGCDNALGNLMFYFTNPYSTYLHDTNNRKAFGKHIRALSHGCMRVENPVDLANYMLSREGPDRMLNVAEVENCQLNRKRKQINLTSPFPIHVRYFTCSAEKGKLVYYPDIYHQDAALLNRFLQE